MNPRNPNGLAPHQLRDCTFQDWADPIERPAPQDHWLPVTCAWLLVAAAFGTVIWKWVTL